MIYIPVRNSQTYPIYKSEEPERMRFTATIIWMIFISKLVQTQDFEFLFNFQLFAVGDWVL